MPRRVVRAILDHLDRHPRRVAATLAILLAISWGLALYAVKRSTDTARQGRIENCRAINELRRELFITFTDWQVDPVTVDKFIPTTDCESLP